MNDKIITFALIGIFLLAGVVIAQVVGNPPNIPNGFALNLPNLPSANGQLIKGICKYNPNEITITNLGVYENYGVSLGSYELIYKFQINTPTCASGFVGNVSYNQLTNPVNVIQQDFENQILGSIAVPSPEPQPIATGQTP